jgi:hypothetical protein
MRVIALVAGLLGVWVGCSSSNGVGDAGAGGAGAGSGGAHDSGAGGAGSAADAAAGSPGDASLIDAASGGADGSAGQSGADATVEAKPLDAPLVGDAGSACQAIAALDRSCSVDADCLAVRHVSNCCGQEIFIGIRTTESARFQNLEAACDSAYPACGCAAGLPLAQDGSALVFGGPKAGVTCLRGTCTTFSPVCGHACEGGRSCFACADQLNTYASCSIRCTDGSECKEPNVPTCQDSPTGRFCTSAGITCNTR